MLPAPPLVPRAHGTAATTMPRPGNSPWRRTLPRVAASLCPYRDHADVLTCTNRLPTRTAYLNVLWFLSGVHQSRHGCHYCRRRWAPMPAWFPSRPTNRASPLGPVEDPIVACCPGPTHNLAEPRAPAAPATLLRRQCPPVASLPQISTQIGRTWSLDPAPPHPRSALPDSDRPRCQSTPGTTLQGAISL
jgi:hypothetical protein